MRARKAARRRRELALLRLQADAAWKVADATENAAQAAEEAYPGGVQNMWEQSEAAYRAAADLQAKLDARVLSAPPPTSAPLLRVAAPFRFIGESGGRDFLVEVDAAQAVALAEAQLEAAIGGAFWRVRVVFPGAEAFPTRPSQNCEAMVLAVGPLDSKGRAEVLLRSISDQTLSLADKAREAEF